MGASTSERELSQHGEGRRRDILECAAELFTEKGFKETRVADIAAHAGVAKGLVYWYFETKEQLLRELMLDVRDRLRARQADAVRGLESPLDIIYVGTRTSVEFVLEHFPLYGLAYQASAQLGVRPIVYESTRQHVEDAASMIRRGQRLGEIRTGDRPHDLAVANMGVVNNVAIAFSSRSGSAGKAGGLAARYVVHSLAVTRELADDVVARNRHGRRR